MKVKPPLALQYKKDPTRPGGGVFIARGTTNEAVDKHLPQGTIINEEQERAWCLSSLRLVDCDNAGHER